MTPRLSMEIQGVPYDNIEKTILLFKNEGIAGERFADTVKRLGFEYVNEKLIG